MRSDEQEKIIEVTISPRIANISSFVLFFSANLIFGTWYSFLWSVEAFFFAWKEFLTNYSVLIVSLLTGAICHEGLHALSWALFTSKKFQSITVGMNWKHLSPYVHVDEFMTKSAYALGVAVPGVVLGIVPMIAGIISNVGWLLCFGILFTAGAGGDFYSLMKLRRFPTSCLVLDHSEHIGFLVKLVARN